MSRLTINSKLFIAAVVASGIAAIGTGMWTWGCRDYTRLATFFVLTAVAAALKVRLPGMTTTMSVWAPMVLIALFELSFSEAVILAVVAGAVQCLWKPHHRPMPVQVVFSVATTVTATAVAHLVFRGAASAHGLHTKVLLQVLASALFMVVNVAPVAVIVALTEGKKLLRVADDIFTWTFPYYAASAGIAVITGTIRPYVGWQAPLVILVIMYLVFRSYSRFIRPVAVQVPVPAQAAAAKAGV